MKSVTINEIASSLNTSRNTVSKVLNGRGYVSDILKKRIIVEAVEKGYRNISPELMEYYNSLGDTSRPASYSIAVIAACPEASSYWTQIITSITNEINATPHRLFYHFMTPQEEEHFTLPRIIVSDRIDGLILLNVLSDDAISQIAELPMAKVYLDLPAGSRFSLRGDAILPESETSIYKLTEHLIAQKHCSTLGFIGDISIARSSLECYRGFRSALDDRHVPFCKELCLLNGQDRRRFFPEELEMFLHSVPEIPDAFVCSSDLTAYTVHQKLHELMPSRACTSLISGYGNLPPYGISRPFLPTVDINTALLGKKLVEQLFWRLANPDMPYETVHLSTRFLSRS